MAYTINLTDGTIFATIADGTINTDSSMVLVGKNYAGYGEFLDENFVHLLESGSNTTAPSDPLTGQLWWDKTNNLLKVYNGTLFKSISGAIASTTTPTSNVTGDLWWDTTNDQLKAYNGAGFTLIGPAFTAGTGTSGAIVDTITDSSPGSDHIVIKMFVNNTICGIWSKDAEFTPAAAISGFATIKPGLNMSTTVSNAKFHGTATNADTLDSLDSTVFMRTNTATSNDTSISITSDTGLYVGSSSIGRLRVSGIDVYVQNTESDGDMIFQVNDGGVTTAALTIDGATTNATFNANLTADNLQLTTGNCTAGNINNGGANGTGNIGSAGTYFNRVFATSTSALYADVAERFSADAVYEAGTVVMLGGVEEVTLCDQAYSDDVFGVVSTNPAFLMNGGAGEDETHPAIAMTGRVPVKVSGTVNKGDRLVSAGDGVAMSAVAERVTAFNVIGRALEDKTDSGLGTVEAIVKIN